MKKVNENSSNICNNIINMLPNEYLSDILNTLTNIDPYNRYTINFYNHSKTIDRSK